MALTKERHAAEGRGKKERGCVDEPTDFLLVGRHGLQLQRAPTGASQLPLSELPQLVRRLSPVILSDC